MSNFYGKSLAAHYQCQGNTRPVCTQRGSRSTPPSRKTTVSRPWYGMQGNRELFLSPAAVDAGTRGQVNDFVYSPNKGLYDHVEDLECFDYDSDNCLSRQLLSNMVMIPPSENIRSPSHPVPSVASRDPILSMFQEQQSLLQRLLKEQQELRNLVKENKVVHFCLWLTYTVFTRIYFQSKMNTFLSA